MPAARTQAPEQSAIVRSMRPVAVSIGVGAAACALVLLVMAAVLSARSVPHSLIDPMALFAVSVGGFVAGACCGRIMRAGGLLYGAVCGAVLTFVVLTSGLAISETGLGMPALFRGIFIMLSAMLGGVLGVNAKGRRR